MADPYSMVPYEAPAPAPPKYHPGELQAIKNFAVSKGIAEAEVDLMIVIKSPEGIGHWYAVEISTTKRSPFGQAFGRALDKDIEAKTTYGNLTDEYKKKFREAWGYDVTSSFARRPP